MGTGGATDVAVARDAGDVVVAVLTAAVVVVVVVVAVATDVQYRRGAP